MENYFLELPEQSQPHGTCNEAAQNYSRYQNVALARVKHDAIFQILLGYLLMDYLNLFKCHSDYTEFPIVTVPSSSHIKQT